MGKNGKPNCKVFENALEREQPSVLSRWLSSKADHVQSFDSKDKCSIFDQNGMLVKETTFGQAKLFASSQNFRLVYMSKNPDGLLCFSLQQLPVKTEKGKAIEENTSELSRGKKKDTKAVAKEYKIKASIADRDLDIKLSQMHSHLSKGKQVIIFIKENKSQSSVLLKEGSELVKKIKDELDNLCKLNQDYSNATTTRLTLTPKETLVSPSISSKEKNVVKQ
ncbi:hypothetical protein RRG08_035077 [Elysia crispata]|uniref:Uncharacterized protein n=1 Tax=Elysia crispata TaxID=231223 RepID=A0AAE0ZSC0_9GAST|nr:hypothetical protein RRG08_035077 [Elysia crispata]